MIMNILHAYSITMLLWCISVMVRNWTMKGDSDNKYPIIMLTPTLLYLILDIII